MMKVEKVVKDFILLILDNHKSIKKFGINQNKTFVSGSEGFDFPPPF
tara:strand:- start:222 stop:362 length:141 start_codon:yes stop_codon:yes gene_type:complete